MAVTREMIMRKVLPVFALLLSAALLAESSGAASVRTHPVGRGVDAADLIALRAALAENLKSLHEAASFPGATLGFVLPDGRSGSVSVGTADIENKIPLRPNDRMLAGSIGKTYVSAVMLGLVQEGKVNLDSKIERWFGNEPWFSR